jgi:hypothetical protein
MIEFSEGPVYTGLTLSATELDELNSEEGYPIRCYLCKRDHHSTSFIISPTTGMGKLETLYTKEIIIKRDDSDEDDDYPSYILCDECRLLLELFSGRTKLEFEICSVD